MTNKSKYIAGIISIALIALLVVAGPAQAFMLSLDVDAGENSNFHLGDDVSLTAKLHIEDSGNDAYLPVKNLSLEIDGPGSNDYLCYFDINGNAISECDNISISLVNGSVSGGYGYGYGYFENHSYDFGYGYGYGYSNGIGETELVYKIVIDTDSYHLGSYHVTLNSEIGNSEFSSSVAHFVLSERAIHNVGGPSTFRCRTDWQCTGWSLCSQNIQTRMCDKAREECYTDTEEPDEVRACTINLNNNPNINLNNNENSNSNSNSETQTKKSLGARITGAVTGFAEDVGIQGQLIIVIAFIAGILGLSVAVRAVRRRRLSVK